MTVRDAADADVPAITTLVNRAYVAESFIVLGGRTTEDEVRAMLGRAGSAWLVIGYDEPAGSGMAGAVFVEAHGERGHFGPLAVDPTRQGRGLGRRLVGAAEAWCRARGCTMLELDVVNVRTELPPFYRGLGFIEAGRLDFPKPEKLRGDAHLIVMRKSLA